ncbi:MAG: T9SS type A sorting domain-containing protein [Chitinophagales bacterium]|nr:T9SS type A sorting domain-containing protein [Chitinophagales bacterium]
MQVRQNTTVSNTTSTAAICEDQTKAITYTVAGGGSGTPTLSIVSGGGSISGTTYTPANISVNTNVTIRATLGVCTSDRTFLVYADPIVTNTTSTAAICEDQTKALVGTTSVGSGTWSIVSGGGSISGTTYTPANIASNTNVTIRYTGTNGTCTSTADRTFTVYADPIVTNTTSTAAICEDQTKALAGTGSVGSGVWSIVSGGGTISGTTYTPANIAANTNVTVRYTWTNGTCTSSADRTFLVYADPIVTNTTSTAAICEDQTKALSGTGSVGTGVWSVVSGGGTISGTTYTPANIASNTNVTVRYTWTNGTCTSSADATFLVYADPIVTNTTSTAAICEDQTKALTGTGSVGSGVWSIVSGGGTISGSTYTPANITANTNVTIRYAWTNGTCSSFADATFTVHADPIVSNTTSTAAICETGTKALVGSFSGTSGLGTESWTIVSGSGSISGTTYTPANITASVSVTVRYTVTNGTCSSSQDASFIVHADPLVSNTTSSADMCEDEIRPLTGSFSGTGGVGNETWTIISGPGFLVGTDYNPGNITANALTTIRYNVSNGTCSNSETVSFTVYADPIVTNSTGTGAICETGTKTLSGSWSGTSGAGTASWSIISGGGSISGTTYTPANVSANTPVTIRYTVTNGSCSSSADVNFTVFADPSVSNTTSSTPLCETSTRALNGSWSGTGGAGVATWSIISGGGSISGTTYTPANVTANTNVTIRYTVTNGPCSRFEDVSFTVEANPTVTSSSSSMCQGETRTLTTDVVGATFSGIGVSGNTFTAPDPGGVTGNYVITVQNGTCSSFQVITVYGIASITSSSADMCEGETRTLTASLGGGIWTGTGVSGNTFTAPTPAGLSQTYTITYTTIGSPCPPATQDITVHRQPTASAGGSTSICANTNYTLAPGEATASNGTISWSHDGDGGFVGATNTTTPTYGSVFTDGGNAVTLTMTVSNGSCSPATASYTINVDALTTASAGPNQYVCLSSTAIMAANNPSTWTGTWSWVGPGTVTYETGNSNSFDAEVSFSASGDYTGTWTVVNGTCSSSDDVIMYVNNPNPLAMADVVGTCLSDGVNGWVHVYDPTGQNIIASVNDYGQNIGDVTATLYYHGGNSFSVPANNGQCPGYWQAVLNRSFVISTSIAPSSAVGVRLYFTDGELADLIANAGCNDANGCDDDDDVCSINGLYVTQISGAASEDGTFSLGSGTFTLHDPTNSGTGNANFGGNWVEFNVNGFSEFWIHGSESGVPLPVELLSFEAKAVDNSYINLSWSTATEINNEGFEVLRSTNGVDFEKVAWIAGNGNSTEELSYTWNDYEVTRGMVYYYQLKQVDYDGQYEYFDIVSAKLEASASVTIIGDLIPNPSKENGIVRTTIRSGMEEEVQVSVYNHIGMKVSEEKYPLREGSNTIDIAIENLASGTYFIYFEGDFGRETKKLVIAK